MKSFSQKLIIAFLLLFATGVIAQDTGHQFGNLTMEQYLLGEEDTFATVQHFDIGASHFEFNNNRIKLVTEVISRIKFNRPDPEETYKWQTIVYESGPYRQAVDFFRANIYELKDGLVEKRSYVPEETREELAEGLYRATYRLPDFQPGSVVEFKYVRSSDFFWIVEDWEFQSQMPVLYSEYSIVVPEELRFRTSMKGYLDLPSSNFKQEEVEKGTKYTWFMQDIPPFIREAYSRPEINYVQAIQFDLTEISMAGQQQKIDMSWEEVISALISTPGFGSTLKKEYFSDVEEVMSAARTGGEKGVRALFEYVRDNFEWNGNYGAMLTSDLKTALKEKKGSVGDLNLTLVNLLRSAGYQSFPVLVSTRENGMAKASFPTDNSFNYVIAAVVLDGKKIYMDASETFSDLNMLPDRCMNGEALMVKSDKEFEWVEPAYSSSTRVLSYNLKLTGTQSLEGVLQSMTAGHGAMRIRRAYSELGDEQRFRELYEKESPGLEVQDMELTGMDEAGSTLRQSMTITLNDLIEEEKGLIRLMPVPNGNWTSNPFKVEIRPYPVDFINPFKHTVIVNITLPDGYGVETLPMPIRLESEDNSMHFTYSANQIGNMVQVSSNLAVDKPVYTSLEYEGVRRFFGLVADKHLETITLKRL